jgi:hypothetical protein
VVNLFVMFFVDRLLRAEAKLKERCVASRQK